MKFPTEFGVGEVCGDQWTARQCYIGCAIPKKKLQDEASVNQIVEVDPREIIEVPKPIAHEPLEPIEEIVLDENLPERVIKIGTKIQTRLRDELVSLLREFPDVFA